MLYGATPPVGITVPVPLVGNKLHNGSLETDIVDTSISFKLTELSVSKNSKSKFEGKLPVLNVCVKELNGVRFNVAGVGEDPVIIFTVTSCSILVNCNVTMYSHVG